MTLEKVVGWPMTLEILWEDSMTLHEIVGWPYDMKKFVGWPCDPRKYCGMVCLSLTTLQNRDLMTLSKYGWPLVIININVTWNLFMLECICYTNKIKMLYLTLDGPMTLEKIVGWSDSPRKILGDSKTLENIVGWSYDIKKKNLWDDPITL